MERRTFDFRSPYRVLPQECDRCPVKPIGEGKTPDALAHSIAGRVESLCRSHRVFETGAQYQAGSRFMAQGILPVDQVIGHTSGISVVFIHPLQVDHGLLIGPALHHGLVFQYQ